MGGTNTCTVVKRGALYFTRFYFSYISILFNSNMTSVVDQFSDFTPADLDNSVGTKEIRKRDLWLFTFPKTFDREQFSGLTLDIPSTPAQISKSHCSFTIGTQVNRP